MSIFYASTVIACLTLVGVCRPFSTEYDLKLENDVESLTLSVMRALEIRHGIMVKNERNYDGKWNDVKKFSVNFLPILYFNKDDVLSYMMQATFMNVKTITILNEKNIFNIRTLLEQLEELNILYRVSRFTWLIFLEKAEDDEMYQKLLVPYNCEFIIVYPVNTITYKMIEVYKIKNETVILDFGTWDRRLGLSITNIPLCRRRVNFHNEKLILNSYVPENACSSSSRRVCVHIEVMKDLANALNFRYDWIWTPESSVRGIHQYDKTPNNSDILQVIYPFETDFNVFQSDIVGPIFKLDVNWHIREPSSSKNQDYYVAPLELDSWIATIGLIFIGVLTILIQIISRKRILNEGDKLKFSNIDGIFMPLETFCNQEGSENMTFKTIGFAFRFASIFIWAIYGATITSFLMIQIPKIPFTNLEGFVENGQYLMGFNTKAGKLPQTLLEFSRVPIIKHVNERFTKKSKGSREVNEICDEKLALMSVDYDIYKNKINCKVITIKNPILLTFTIIPLKKNSPYTHTFNYILKNYYSSGLVQRIKAIDFDMTYKPDIEDEFQPVEIDQMVQVLSIVPIGLVFALTAFVCEIVSKFYIKIKCFKHYLIIL